MSRRNLLRKALTDYAVVVALLMFAALAEAAARLLPLLIVGRHLARLAQGQAPGAPPAGTPAPGAPGHVRRGCPPPGRQRPAGRRQRPAARRASRGAGVSRRRVGCGQRPAAATGQHVHVQP